MSHLSGSATRLGLMCGSDFGPAAERELGRKHPLETLAIMPTWECDIVCHHCVFNSSPSLKGRLTAENACAAIAEVAKVSCAKRVTISGGESFLDIDYLAKLSHASRTAGLAFRVVTNGSFAKDASSAERAIGTIAQIGLETVGISWDQFHARFVPPERIKNAIRACRKLQVGVRLTVVVTKKSNLAAALEPLGDEAFELPITQVKCLPVGRAEKKIRSDDLLPPASSDIGRACRSDFDTLSLTPNGDVFPCCAVGGFTDGIRLGRFPQESIETLLERRERELLWVVLAAQGPKYFIASLTDAERAELGLDQVNSESLHDCAACHKLFRNQRGRNLAEAAVARLREQAASMWQDLSNTRHE